MSHGFKIPEQAALAEQAEAMLQIGDDYETVLRFLRAGGMGKIDSMRAIAQANGISILEARDIVQKSDAWKHAPGR